MCLMGSEITLINSLLNTSTHKNKMFPPTQLKEQPDTKGTQQKNKTVSKNQEDPGDLDVLATGTLHQESLVPQVLR